MARPYHHHPSTYVAFASWGATAFTALPTFVSVVVHVANVGLLALLLWQAHREGRVIALGGQARD